MTDSNYSKKIRIGITGPESSGKSTLAGFLANKYKATLVLEYAREYFDALKLEKGSYKYVLSDVISIAKEQFQRNNQNYETDVIVCDTEMTVIKVWVETKFGRCPSEIDKLFKTQKFDIILLCKPDIDWEFDPLREDATTRNELYEKYKKTLEFSSIPFKIVSGRDEKRETEALKQVENYIYNKV